MGKLESTIESEIQRLAKREIRTTFLPLRREVRDLDALQATGFRLYAGKEKRAHRCSPGTFNTIPPRFTPKEPMSFYFMSLARVLWGGQRARKFVNRLSTRTYATANR